MTNATFFNWTNEAFTGYWNGKGRAFAAGERQYMPAWLAEHFAKHLTNRELLKAGKETAVSPKFPEQVPEFMELFNKAFIPDANTKEESEIEGIMASAAVDGPSMDIHVAPSTPIDSHSPAAAQAKQASDAGATVLTGPADDDDDYQPEVAPIVGTA